MSINGKSMRVRSWCDQLHSTGMYKPSFEKAIRLLTYLLAETVSPKYMNYVKRELAKVVAQHPDLTAEQLKIYGILTDKIDKKFTLIQERAERRQAKKLAAKDSTKPAKAKQAPAAVPTPTPAPTTGDTPWD